MGASDNLARGASTFLVEMQETANILNNATAKSLILLDEVGRGTSTYDGLSLAWAVVEYLHNEPRVAARTLFATHYHELTQLEERLAGLGNLNVAVHESGDGVVFLHRVEPGAADAECQGGLLLIPELRSEAFPSRMPGNSMHVYDYSLFYLNIRKNATERVAAFLAEHDAG